MGFRYIGSKSNLIQVLLARISEIVPPASRVTDLMAGTGAVSAALRKAGYRVTAVDVMTYSYHHCIVALMFTGYPKFVKLASFAKKGKVGKEMLLPTTRYEEILNALVNLPPTKGYFFKEFSLGGSPANGQRPRNYFSPENAMAIDSIRYKVSQFHDSGEINNLEYSLLLHDLIMAANDVANIAGTYGHYLSVLRGRAKARIQLKPTALIIRNDANSHKVMQGYAENLSSKIECDVCYIDPPYMKRQYAANYHVLETLARGDEPVAVGVSGLRPWRDQYSNFCTKTKIRGSFSSIFENMKTDKFLISYSEDGLLKIHDMVTFFENYGKVEINKFHNLRFKSNDSKLDKKLTEYLIFIRRN